MGHVPSVLYFYGLAGVGKNFVGDAVARMTGWVTYHADEDLTPAMRAATLENKVWTDAMRDGYYTIVVDKILALRVAHKHLIVTQGTYKTKHRAYLMSRIPDMDMICVVADDAMMSERLRKRGDAITPDYAAVIRANFEPPSAESKMLINDGDVSRVTQQLAAFYPDLSSLAV